jgi:hypothetical protein
MTIRSVRINYYPTTKRREHWLTANYWGFSEWFDGRLKTKRERLRGVEVKGVDIVNLMLYENPLHAWKPNEWKRRGNTLEFAFVCNLCPLEHGDKLDNVALLMRFYGQIAGLAPWPQMQAVAEALSAPLTDVERTGLLPFLQWPRSVGYAAQLIA